MRYLLPAVQLETDVELTSFAPFLSDQRSELLLIRLAVENTVRPIQNCEQILFHKELHVIAVEDGWMFCRADRAGYILHATKDYSKLTAYLTAPQPKQELLQPLIRTALECAAAFQGAVSLHSACVKLEDSAVCFSAPSGTGKSTRAAAWCSGLGAELISGDRPTLLLTEDGIQVCGVPWDGKEQTFNNDRAPLRAICSIRRGDFTRVRKLSPRQARRFLMQQCFVPMWDPDAAAMVTALVARLSRTAPIYQAVCGPDEQAARELHDILYHHPEQIREIESDMKIKNGFVLRSVAGEHVVMPTGENISKFDGTIVLNGSGAFLWKKLANPVSREDLLEYLLAEYEVEREQAARDLDALLDTLRGYGVLEEEPA